MDHSEGDKRFYVYLHIDENGHVRYIGSGTADRYKVKVDRTDDHLMLWNSLSKVIVLDEMSSAGARDLEQLLITSFKDSGCLLNKQTTVSKSKDYKWDYFDKFLEYSELSPSGLVWKVSPSTHIKVGVAAGGLGSKGYWNVGIHRKYYRNHRIIYALCTKMDLPNNLVIDHIDGDKSNNKIQNLRLTTHIGNAINKGIRSDNKTNVTGVRWCNTLSKWYATWVDNLKSKSKSFKPDVLYPDIPYEEAKKKAFEDAVNCRVMIEESLYKPLDKMLEDKYNIHKSLLGL